ncbi:thioredoxin [Mariniflexile sp. HNIBRBA6329]|uniref:thioredoxin n=1 Tax=Mariniflexile sp. HNIBRBA6329 TaxID=3373088 RepID=UPI003744C298
MSNFSEIISKNKLVLVDFYAEWCGPCKTMHPILKEVKDALGDEISVIKINIDKNQSLTEKYRVKGVPTFMLYKNGVQVWRQSGIVQKNELIMLIKSHN